MVRGSCLGAGHKPFFVREVTRPHEGRSQSVLSGWGHSQSALSSWGLLDSLLTSCYAFPNSHWDVMRVSQLIWHSCDKLDGTEQVIASRPGYSRVRSSFCVSIWGLVSVFFWQLPALSVLAYSRLRHLVVLGEVVLIYFVLLEYLDEPWFVLDRHLRCLDLVEVRGLEHRCETLGQSFVQWNVFACKKRQ